MSRALAAAFGLAISVGVACGAAETAGEQSAAAVRPLVGTTFTAHVVGVLDGDTVDVRRAGGSQFRVRVHGIDAPEREEPFHTVARNRLRVLAFDHDATLTGRDVDVYGRLVAQVVIDGEDVGVTLVAAGLACHYRRYSSDPALIRAEADARRAGLGFWAANAKKPGCVAREAASSGSTPARSATATTAGDARVIGNTSSRLYHRLSCANATCRNCTRTFATAAEAERAGFKAARDCH